MTRALIVNGDDFGLTSGINAGIVEAHTRGILTSASLFPNAPATADAIELARRHPALGVGCHLTLVDGTPVLAASQLPSLAPAGSFPKTWRHFIAAILTGRIALGEIERELTAQIDRVRAAGVQPTHLDSHKHVHAYPPIFRIVTGLAQRFGIGAVRVPCEPNAWAQAIRFAGQRHERRQALENLALAPWAGMDRRILNRCHVHPVRFLGRIRTGLFTPATFCAELRSLPEGTSELMLHPGYTDAALDRVSTRLREARVAEVAILTDPEVIHTVSALGIVLTRHDGHAPGQLSHVS